MWVSVIFPLSLLPIVIRKWEKTNLVCESWWPLLFPFAHLISNGSSVRLRWATDTSICSLKKRLSLSQVNSQTSQTFLRFCAALLHCFFSLLKSFSGSRQWVLAVSAPFHKHKHRQNGKKRNNEKESERHDTFHFAGRRKKKTVMKQSELNSLFVCLFYFFSAIAAAST